MLLAKSRPWFLGYGIAYRAVFSQGIVRKKCAFGSNRESLQKVEKSLEETVEWMEEEGQRTDMVWSLKFLPWTEHRYDGVVRRCLVTDVS